MAPNFCASALPTIQNRTFFTLRVRCQFWPWKTSWHLSLHDNISYTLLISLFLGWSDFNTSESRTSGRFVNLIYTVHCHFTVSTVQCCRCFFFFLSLTAIFVASYFPSVTLDLLLCFAISPHECLTLFLVHSSSVHWLWDQQPVWDKEQLGPEDLQGQGEEWLLHTQLLRLAA